MLDRTLRRLEKKYGKYSVNGLMLYIVGTMLLLYIADFLTPLMGIKGSILSFINFDRDLIFRGQVWRLISFIFMPPGTSPIFIVFELYFCWLFGTSLESRWGSFRFNVYYLIGTLGAIIGGLITGYASNNYLNMSLLIAFALLFPNYEILLFFIIPIRMKWIAVVDLVLLGIVLLLGSLSTKLMIVLSLANLLLFFGKDIYTNVRYFFKLRLSVARKKRKSKKRAVKIDIKDKTDHE